MPQRTHVRSSVASILAILPVVIFRSVAPSAQTGTAIRVNPEVCAECPVKTAPPDAKFGRHGSLRWYSDADARDPKRSEPLTDEHCFIRSVHNQGTNQADYRWDVGGLSNSNMPPGEVDKRCDGTGSVANPPSRGPLIVNYLKPDVSTEVWKSTATVAQASDKDNVLRDLTTTLETALYLPSGQVEPLQISFTSRVQLIQGRFQYSYVIRRGASGTAPYLLAWTGAETPAFVTALKELGVAQAISVNKLSPEPLTISYLTDAKPRRTVGPVTLSQSGGQHVIEVAVEVWRPNEG
jgi:hypothetical protein